MRKLYNFWYVFKWVFVKKWYTGRKQFLDLAELKQSGKEKIKETCPISLLSPGQIEGMIHMIKWLRSFRLYKLSDKLRDRLVSIGWAYYEPPKNFWKNYKSGPTVIKKSTLFFQIVDGEVSVGGDTFKNEFLMGDTFFYSTGPFNIPKNLII